MVFTNPQIRILKSKGQLLEPILKVGKEGLSDGFLQSVDISLGLHELVKIKFAACKDEKKQLSPLLAEKTSSHLVMRVGNVVVLYRPHSEPAKRKVLT
jgi:RNA-binding protein